MNDRAMALTILKKTCKKLTGFELHQHTEPVIQDAAIESISELLSLHSEEQNQGLMEELFLPRIEKVQFHAVTAQRDNLQARVSQLEKALKDICDDFNPGGSLSDHRQALDDMRNHAGEALESSTPTTALTRRDEEKFNEGVEAAANKAFEEVSMFVFVNRAERVKKSILTLRRPAEAKEGV